jgi:hypothetical protein
MAHPLITLRLLRANVAPPSLHVCNDRLARSSRLRTEANTKKKSPGLAAPGLQGFDVSISKDTPDTNCKQKKFGGQCAIRDSVAFGSKNLRRTRPGSGALTGRGASKAITVQASAISRRVCRRRSSSVSSAKRRHSQANCWHFWRLDMA